MEKRITPCDFASLPVPLQAGQVCCRFERSKPLAFARSTGFTSVHGESAGQTMDALAERDIQVVLEIFTFLRIRRTAAHEPPTPKNSEKMSRKLLLCAGAAEIETGKIKSALLALCPAAARFSRSP